MTRVLFVCLGNICRSPTAEGVMGRLLTTEAADLAVEVDSAGTADYHVGAAPDARSQAAAKRRGIDLSGLRARQIVAADFSRFDFILAMDGANLAHLHSIRPATATAHLDLLLKFAPNRVCRDVPDPYYGTKADFDQVLDLVEAGARGLIEFLKSRVSLNK